MVLAGLAVRGVLLDVDGTLLDSNDAHAESWVAVFKRNGLHIPFERVRPLIGKGGDKLVPSVIGEGMDRADGDAIREAHPKEYAKLARAKGLRVFPGARELVAELRRRKIATVLATSSGQGHIKATEEASGLKLAEMFDHLECIAAD